MPVQQRQENVPDLREYRALRTFQTKEAVVAKLFAKHIKLKDAIEYVKKTRFVNVPS